MQSCLFKKYYEELAHMSENITAPDWENLHSGYLHCHFGNHNTTKLLTVEIKTSLMIMSKHFIFLFAPRLWNSCDEPQTPTHKKDWQKKEKEEDFCEIIQLRCASVVISQLRHFSFSDSPPSLLSHFQLKLMHIITFPHRKELLSATKCYWNVLVTVPFSCEGSAMRWSLFTEAGGYDVTDLGTSTTTTTSKSAILPFFPPPPFLALLKI